MLLENDLLPVKYPPFRDLCTYEMRYRYGRRTRDMADLKEVMAAQVHSLRRASTHYVSIQ
jgi:hypothetical protein